MVAGKKGCGKSVVASWIFEKAQNRRKAILNPKKDRRLMELYPNVVTDIRKVDWSRGPANILVPSTLTNKRAYETYFAQLYRAGNILIDLDEAGVMATESQYAPHLQAIVVEGRSRGIGLIICTQRVRRIPGFFRSEADHYFIFKLQNAGDRAALEEDTSVNWQEAGELQPHEFLYYNDTMDAPKRQAPLQNVKLSHLSGG